MEGQLGLSKVEILVKESEYVPRKNFPVKLTYEHTLDAVQCVGRSSLSILEPPKEKVWYTDV